MSRLPGHTNRDDVRVGELEARHTLHTSNAIV